MSDKEMLTILIRALKSIVATSSWEEGEGHGYSVWAAEEALKKVGEARA